MQYRLHTLLNKAKCNSLKARCKEGTILFLDKLKGMRNLRLSVFAHTQFKDKAIKIYYTMNRKSVFSPTVDHDFFVFYINKIG